MIEFFVAGVPASQGSKRHVGHGVMIESSKQLRPWRAAVAAEAAIAMRGAELLQGPLKLEAVFVMPRPKSHFGAKGLKASAPIFLQGRPDMSKTLRAIEDAMTGIVYHDDAQIAMAHLSKIYGNPTGARIILTEIKTEEKQS